MLARKEELAATGGRYARHQTPADYCGGELTSGRPDRKEGLYFGTEDPTTGRYTEHGGTTGKLDPKVPWTKKEVRQAMNKAINREEILEVWYKGRATLQYVNGFYPDLPGWDPTWEQRFPEMYGYDPDAARELLAKAGYPNGFKAKAWLVPFAGAPELIPLMESIQVQLRDVGIELELEEADVVATVLVLSLIFGIQILCFGLILLVAAFAGSRTPA